MKRNLKKSLAISMLSVGTLISSVPSAFCSVQDIDISQKISQENNQGPVHRNCSPSEYWSILRENGILEFNDPDVSWQKGYNGAHKTNLDKGWMCKVRYCDGYQFEVEFTTLENRGILPRPLIKFIFTLEHIHNYIQNTESSDIIDIFIQYINSTPRSASRVVAPDPLTTFHLVAVTNYFKCNDIRNFEQVSKKCGDSIKCSLTNPCNIYLHEDIKNLSEIETFEDHQPLTADENIENRVNTFGNKIKTLIYTPQSFDLERYNYILKKNGIYYIDSDDWKKQSQSGIFTEPGPYINNSISGTDWLTANNPVSTKWLGVIHPFNGIYFKVEFIKTSDTVKSDLPPKRIVFLFSPIKGIGNLNNSMPQYDLRLDPNDFATPESLKEITIPGSVKEIEEGSFRGCTNLIKVTIQEGVERIGEDTFVNCPNLTEITIPSSVKEIEEGSFRGCTNLKKVTFQGDITQINYGTFAFCTNTNVEEITINSSVGDIMPATFKLCNNLREIAINGSVGDVVPAAFMFCNSLKEIAINGSVGDIMPAAFMFCNNFKEIAINGSVGDIMPAAFMFCNNFKKITINGSVGYIMLAAFCKCPSLEKVTIQGDITKLSYGAFMFCNNLKTITINGSVGEIKPGAFDSCNNLESIIYNGRTFHNPNEFIECVNNM